MHRAGRIRIFVDDAKDDWLTAHFTVLDILRLMLAGLHQRCERLTTVWALDEMFFEVHDQDILPDLAQNKRRADIKPCAVPDGCWQAPRR